MPRRAFWAIFDGDDTLFGVLLNGEPKGTQHAYVDVIDRFGSVMEALGFPRETALQRRIEMDGARLRSEGFVNKGRFPTSMRETYESIAREQNGKFDPKIAKQIENLGWSVFTDYPYTALPNALTTLAEAKKDYKIAIVTKGVEEEQHKKVFDSGCWEHADQVIVMGDKSLEEWQTKVIYPLRITSAIRKYSWAIGDSVRADVNPPLRLGFNGLQLLVDKSFSFEHQEVVPPMTGRSFAQISNIKDCLKFLYPQTSEIV